MKDKNVSKVEDYAFGSAGIYIGIELETVENYLKC